MATSSWLSSISSSVSARRLLDLFRAVAFRGRRSPRRARRRARQKPCFLVAFEPGLPPAELGDGQVVDLLQLVELGLELAADGGQLVARELVVLQQPEEQRLGARRRILSSRSSLSSNWSRTESSIRTSCSVGSPRLILNASSEV